MMKALIDTGVWFRNYHGLPLSRGLMECLKEEVKEFYLCPLSVAEIVYKWQRNKLPGVPNPKEWLRESLQGYRLANPNPEICLKAGLWPWEHGDLVDRILAATAVEFDLVLLHTDTVLKGLSGFPQQYFRNLDDR